jgi:hypothetical protein
MWELDKEPLSDNRTWHGECTQISDGEHSEFLIGYTDGSAIVGSLRLTERAYRVRPSLRRAEAEPERTVAWLLVDTWLLIAAICFAIDCH